MPLLLRVVVFSQGTQALVVPMVYYVVPVLLSAGMLACHWRRWSSPLMSFALPLVPAIVALLFGASWVGMGIWHVEAMHAPMLSWPSWLGLPMLMFLLP